jgi:hypothetical protein
LEFHRQTIIIKLYIDETLIKSIKQNTQQKGETKKKKEQIMFQSPQKKKKKEKKMMMGMMHLWPSLFLAAFQPRHIWRFKCFYGY